MQPPPPYSPYGPPVAPPPPRAEPRNGLAIGLAITSCFVMPVVYLVATLVLVADRHSHGFDGLVAIWALGFGVWVAALVASIRAIVVSGTVGSSRAAGVVGVVLSLLSTVTAAVSIFFSFLLAGGGGPHGRPLRVGGRPRTAPTRHDDAWSAATDVPRPDVDGWSKAERAREAARWTRDAREEHASVAAFSRLSLDLLALGADPSLVERAHRAALDEVRHARLAFALASAYTGAPVGPDAWPDARASHGAETAGETLRRVAAESLVDGAYGEGLAARRAEEERADDPAVAAVLAVVARDEAEHAALGWDVLAFCLGRDGSLANDLAVEARRLVSRAGTALEREQARAVSEELGARLGAAVAAAA